MKTHTTDTTTYINRRNEFILVVHHNGPWAEYGELNSLTDHALNRHPTKLNIKTVNNLLAYWGADAEQAA